MTARSSGSPTGPADAEGDEPLDVDAYRTLARFRYQLRTFHRFSEDAAKAAGITPAQHQLLLAIVGHPSDEPPSLSEIAERLQLRLHSAGELVGRAVANDLVARRMDPEDHRRILLSATANGLEILAELTRVHRAEVRRFREEMAEVLGDLG